MEEDATTVEGSKAEGSCCERPNQTKQDVSVSLDEMQRTRKGWGRTD